MRTASLFPSATEIVGGLGATPDLVGRSHRCNHPPAVDDVPVVTESRLAERATPDPGAVDAAIDDHRHGEGSHFRVLTDRLQAADPEVVIAQSLCEVCAVPESMTVEALEHLETTPELVTLGPHTIDGVFESIERVGRTLDREAEADRLVEDLRSRVEAVRRRRPAPAEPPRVVCLEWVDALRCHGLWMPESLELLGAEVGFGRPGEHGRVVEWEDVIDYDPEVLIVSPCGRSVTETEADLASLVDRPGWSDLAAVRDDRVFLLDGELSSRHGPRVVRALELAAAALYPERFSDVDPSRDELVRLRDAG